MDWQNELARAIRHPQQLLEALSLSREGLPPALAAARDFSLRVPWGYVARMKQGDPDDPLLRQILPVGEELVPQPGYTADPVGDLDAMPIPGLLHKYHGRALLITTGACAIHCRYCFRRHFPYNEANPANSQWRLVLDYLAGDATISEVILSGGDPLMLSDERLAELLTLLRDIPHLKRLRIHSRLPVVLPERITEGLIGLLTGSSLSCVMVIHANHVQELDQQVGGALNRLRTAGITLLNQAVLLKGINDSVATQKALNEALFDYGVLPYYLHQLDQVSGVAHFQVPKDQAKGLYQELRRQLPGYLLPRLVVEQAGMPYKIPLDQR